MVAGGSWRHSLLRLLRYILCLAVDGRSTKDSSGRPVGLSGRETTGVHFMAGGPSAFPPKPASRSGPTAGVIPRYSTSPVDGGRHGGSGLSEGEHPARVPVPCGRIRGTVVGRVPRAAGLGEMTSMQKAEPPRFEPRRVSLNERLRAAFITGAEEHSRRRLGRGLTREGLERVLQRYPGDL